MEKVPVASSGRQAFSFFSNTEKTFSIFISWHRLSRMEVKRRIYLHFIDPLFATHIRHVTMKLFLCLPWASRFKPQKHACHSIQLKNSVHPNQPRSWNTCHQRREEKNFPFCYSCQLLCVGCEKFAGWFMRSSSADNKSSAKLFLRGLMSDENNKILHQQNA